MAKKTKATRRTRAKKEAAIKKKAAPVATLEEAVIIAEGSDEPVAKTPKAESKKTTKKASPKKATAPAERPIDAEDVKTLESIDATMRPQRLNMIAAAGLLVAVLIASITTAAFMGSRTAMNAQNQQNRMPQSSAQTPTDPDKLLETGGGICTNGKTQTNPEQSVDPSTVGMMLQSVPSQQIQTPQGLGSSNDTSTLQGASCF